MEMFWHWWQHLPEKIDPVIFEVGGFRLQYYGLMYLVAFAVTYALMRYRIGRESRFEVTTDQAATLLTWMMLGVIVGGRLGYVLFYNLDYYLQHPLEIILPFSFVDGLRFTGISGMSFHGGLICVILFSWYYTRKAGLKFLDMADLLVPAIPLGYTFGRIGNFINGELFGRPTAMPFGMVFPMAPGDGLRHPSQLYEAFFEGLALFVLLWNLRRRITTPGAMLAVYLIGYGTVRFFIEFCRQPDPQLGLPVLFFSMGQLLCALMILSGIGLCFFLKRSAAEGD